MAFLQVECAAMQRGATNKLLAMAASFYAHYLCAVVEMLYWISFTLFTEERAENKRPAQGHVSYST